MKHNSMSPFVSKLAGERGLFYMPVVASTLTRGFVQQIMTGRSRWSRETLTSNGSANQPSKREQEDYKRHSHLEFLPMLHLRKWENCNAKEDKWPRVLTSPRKRAGAARLFAWPNDTVCCSHAGKLQNQYVTWFQKDVCQLFCRTDNQKYMVTRRYWKESCWTFRAGLSHPTYS